MEEQAQHNTEVPALKAKDADSIKQAVLQAFVGGHCKANFRDLASAFIWLDMECKKPGLLSAMQSNNQDAGVIDISKIADSDDAKIKRLNKWILAAQNAANPNLNISQRSYSEKCFYAGVAFAFMMSEALFVPGIEQPSEQEHKRRAGVIKSLI